MTKHNACFTRYALRPVRPFLTVCKPSALLWLLPAVLLVSLTGCVHLGTPFEPVELPAGAPSVRDVLASLTENEARLHNFKATGTIMVKLPEMEGIQVSRESVVSFAAPDSLYVLGRRYGTRILNLIYDKDSFLIEFPTRREYYYRPSEESLGSVTTADIVREMFQPEDWKQLNPRLIQMTAYDEEKQTATLVLWEGSGVALRHKRTLKLQGAPWVVLENILYNESGVPVARTNKSHYYNNNDLHYPTQIECTFPQEDVWMRFIMRKVETNCEIDPALFDIPAKLSDLIYKKHKQVDLFRSDITSLDDLSAGTAEENQDPVP
ncbi:MAG: hypothetical protein BWY07_00369 [Candidatus Hydrogenedentes bacterium ADurb.Bin170]|jgi:hypothetical protein|nr:MAG: hypothetical protein BWY07_00369 [Candidatus Hydrogenedentes bacterium ADurb.Bin170]